MQWFTFVDKDSNGSVSPYELQQALSQGGMHFSLQTTSSLVRCVPPSLLPGSGHAATRSSITQVIPKHAPCRMYDPAGTGVVDFAGFERMHNFILQTQENFKIIDRNGDGKLSRAEVETALEQAGMPHSPVIAFAILHATMSSRVSSRKPHFHFQRQPPMQVSAYHRQHSHPSLQHTILHARDI